MGSQHVRLLFEKNHQKELLLSLMNKRKFTQRQLAKQFKVSRRTLRNWINEERLLPNDIFDICIKLLPGLHYYSNSIVQKLPDGWGKIKGGKARGRMKSNLTSELRIKGFRNANKITSKRKVEGPLGEKMYNKGEKKIANLLIRNKLKYKYEPILYLGKKYAFPDFVVKNVLIERCGYSDWSVYWNRLNEKVQLYEKYFQGKIILVTPNNRFDIAIKRIGLNVKNVIILKEDELDVLPSLIMGP